MSSYNPYPDLQCADSEGRPLAIHRPLSEESTPLLPGKPQRVMSREGCKTISGLLFGLLALLFVFGNLGMHFVNCPPYPWTMSAIRRDWDQEVADHALWLENWKHEGQEYSHEVERWKLEKEWHERDAARRVLEENERQERVRKEWEQETEKHGREEEEYDKGVARRVREEQERQASVREQWDLEVQEHKKEVAQRMHEELERQKWVREVWQQEEQKHRQQWEEMEYRERQRQANERQKWQREVVDHDRIVEERKKREEEERQKLNMFWGGIEAHACTTYATKEYSAHLMNLPPTWEHRVEACKATPLEVHGISYLPKSCEDRGPGVVIGTWEINQHEPDCATFWNWYKDKGCTSPGSGKRRIEHYLENLPKGSDWREFCATTPAYFLGMAFSGAQECFQRDLGTYGHWEIDDAGCQ